MQCARHPAIETELACAQCGTPICPRCLVYTPVGVKCPTCANVRKLPQFQIGPVVFARGIAAAIASGAVVGVPWAYFGLLPFIGLLVGLGVGYVIGEAVSIATNRKSGPQLQACAVAGVILAFVVRGAVLAAASQRYDLVDILRVDVFGWVGALLAAFVAVGRLR
jgi:hypothetical protein